MKDNKFAIVTLLLALISSSAFLFLWAGEMREDSTLRQAERYVSVAEAYQKGFAEGSKATLKCVQWNTNTSLGTVELTNVFKVLNRY